MRRQIIISGLLLCPISLSAALNVLTAGVMGNGTSDDSAALQAAIDSSPNVYLPAGTYRACDIRIRNSGTRISGDSSNSTIIFCSTGVAFKNYTGADSEPALLDRNTSQDVSIENLTFQGGANLIADYRTASGRSKPIAAKPRNMAIRWKQSVRNTVRNCAFLGFERAIEVNSGFGNTWEQNRFLGNQIGMYYDTGAAHGDVDYKVTTNNSHRNQYSNNWFGVYSVALVDNSVFLGDIFEMNNTGVYLGNSSLVRISAYFEKNWDGVLFAGSYTGANYIQNSDFVGSDPEGNWGGGHYVQILRGTPATAEVHLLGMPFFNSGNSRGAGVLAEDGRIFFENPSLLQSYSFTNLPQAGSAPQNTTWLIHCIDCKKGPTCSPGGTGALAKYLNNSWDCN